MIIMLTPLPRETVRGIYTIAGVTGRLPDRALFLHPDAAESFLAYLAPYVVVSDMFRSAEASLAAVRAKRGAKAPGFSGHGYGLSIDIDVEEFLRDTGDTKRDLDAWMANRSWYCHRGDHALPSFHPVNEAWHYNYLPGHPYGRASSIALERQITDTYGTTWSLGPCGVQQYLQQLGLYGGAVDGDAGPLTREALRAFQRTWNLPDTGKPDPKTLRTLAYVTADLRVE